MADLAADREAAGEAHFSLTLEHLALDAVQVVTETQATSYWDCYHRQRYPLLHQHPGIRFLRWVDEARQSLPHAD